MRAFFVLLICGKCWVWGQDIDSLSRLGEAYYQAKEYEQAFQVFENLEKSDTVLPWQQGRLLYNIGTILLAEEKWDEAWQHFTAIPFSPQKAPLLSRFVKINTALLFFRKATALISSMKPTIENYQDAVYFYRKALKNMEEAILADCFLKTPQDRESCQPANHLIAWRGDIKTQLAKVMNAYEKTKIQQIKPQEGLILLLSGVNNLLSDVEFLEEISGDMLVPYRELFVHGAESWLPLWEAQQKKLADVKKPKQLFMEGLMHLKRDQFKASRRDWTACAGILLQLIRNFLGTDPLFDVLHQLLTSYQHALDQEPLQVATLYQLKIRQEHVRKIFSKSTDIEAFQLSEDNLEKSVQRARQGKYVQARIYLEEARQWIRRLLRAPTEEKPAKILEAAIEEQAHALSLNHLNQKNAETAPLIQQAQEKTLKTAAPFLAAVRKQEKKDYSFRCQAHPWNRVLPLFFQGRLSAEDAKELLKTRPIAALPSQEAALKSWREALAAMQHFQEETDTRPKPVSAPQKDVSEVLRLLQQMEGEDQPPPSHVEIKTGTRPW